MTTASVLLTVTTTWNVGSEKLDRESRLSCLTKTAVAEAAKELRETQATREQAVSIMKDWIQQNGDIKNVRQDEAFLLRFLRQKKYSIPMAQNTLLRYLGLRKYYPEIFKNLDCQEPRLQEILSDGYITISPVRDNRGRRVIVYNMSRFNTSKFNCWDMCRAHVVVYESLLDDPMDQMCGFTHVGDGSGVNSAHITTWNPTDFARLMKWGEQSLPMRHKDLHLINVPTAVKYVIDFAASKVTPKMVQRLHIYSNLKQLHKQMDPAYLPSLYGGDLPMQDMIDYTRKLLLEKRQSVLDLEKMEILSTKAISTKNNNSAIKDGGSLEGSFRKLEID